MGLIFIQIITKINTKCLNYAICIITNYYKLLHYCRLRAWQKSCPQNSYFPPANGFTSSAFLSSDTLDSRIYPHVSSSMILRHASALLLACAIASRRYFSHSAASYRSVQKKLVSTASISSACFASLEVWYDCLSLKCAEGLSCTSNVSPAIKSPCIWKWIMIGVMKY